MKINAVKTEIVENKKTVKKKEPTTRTQKILNGIFIAISAIMLIIVTISVAVMCAIFTMDMSLHKVDGASMEPTIADKEYVLTRGDLPINRQDIVLIKYQDTLLLKRVIGLPNERVTVLDGQLLINGRGIGEDYLDEEYIKQYKDTTFEVEVPEDSYFVMGDNRDNSSDSRSLGMMKESDIEGVVVAHIKE